MAKEEIKVAMGLDVGPFKRGLSKARGAATSFNAGLGSIGIGSIGAVGLLAFAKSAADAAAELKRTGEAVGENVETVQALGFAASQNGSSVEEMNKALLKLSVNIGKANAGEAEAIRKFQDYGISIRDARGQLIGTDGVLKQIADRVAAAGSGAEKSAITFELLGKSGTGLVQVLGNGAEGLERLKQLAVETGDVISTEANDSIVEFTDTLNRELGGAMSQITEKAGKMMLGIKQLSVFLGSISKKLDGIDILAAIGNPFKIQKIFRELKDGFGEAITDAQRVRAQAKMTAEVGRQLDKLEGIEPLIAKITGLERAREESLESQIEKVNRLEKEEKKLKDLLKGKNDLEIRGDKELATAKLKLLEKQNELQKKQAELVKTENQFRGQGLALQQQLQNAMQSLAAAKGDRSKLSLEELATGNAAGVANEQVARDIVAAKQVQSLLNQAEFQRGVRGDLSAADKLFAKADKLRGTISSLRDAERRPFAGMEDQIKNLHEEQKNLVKLAAEEGIKILIPVVQ